MRYNITNLKGMFDFPFLNVIHKYTKISICILMFFLAFAEVKAQDINFNPGSPCFPGTGPWSFDTPVGSRNSFKKSNSVFIRWNSSLNRWEIYNLTTLIFFNTFASSPNPPDQSTGTWVSVTGCTLTTLTGSSTQNFLSANPTIDSNNITIANNSNSPILSNNTNFGLFNGTPKVVTYTIRNNSTSTLNLTGTAPNYVTLTGNTDFSIITQPNPIIPIGGSSTFQVRFIATGADGVKNATISIPNDNVNINPYTFAISGTKITIDNKRGNMMSFGGTTQSLITNAVASTSTFNVSMEGWFNLANTGAGNPICLMYNGNNFSNGYGLYLLNNKIHILFGGITLLDTGVVPNINTWTHLALVRDPVNWLVYLNGSLIGSFSGGPNTPVGNFRIGSNVNGTAEFLNGQVDEVRFWNKALTRTEIRRNMHLTLTGAETNLTSYYQFNETSGEAIDIINGNNMTLTNVTRTPSTLSVGGGTSKIVNVTSLVAGSEIDLTTTDLEINFNTSGANPNAEVLITEINAEKPFNNTTTVTNTFDAYWVVRSFGTNTGFTFDNIIAKIPNTNNISNIDTNNPNNLRLFSRANNSGTSTWTQVGTANTANNATKEINFNSPTNTFLGEFIVGSSSATSFVSNWITTNGNITIPTFIGETYNYNISWTNLTNAGQGNGSATNVTTQDYAINGLNNNDTYQIEISGTFPRIYFYFGAERSKIRNVVQWGNIAWTSMEYAFLGCNNLISVDGNSPNFTNTTNLNYMFGAAASLNSHLNNWNVSTITNMSNMFDAASVFNGNITNWNTSNVIDMSNMFYNATAFNQNISTWNVSNVTTMTALFAGATAFNQNITTWNTNAVIDIGGMFAGATSFNQNLAGLNISNVVSMINTLDGCGMSRENYDATLIGWASQNVKPNITLGATGRTYCAGKNARNTLLTTKNWTFIGDNFTAACNITSVRGNALVLNGTATSNMTTSTPISILTNSFTVESWLYMNSVNYSTLFTNGGVYGLIVEDGVYKIYVTGIGVYNTGIAPIINEWCHLALQHTGTTWNLFINGNLAYMSVSGVPSTIVPSGGFGIGTNFIGFNRPNMQVDEFRFWESVLTIAQIREKMHLVLEGNEPNIKAYFQFNETTGSKEAINGNDGTLGSNALLNVSSAAVASGTSHRKGISLGPNTFTGTGLVINFTTISADEFVAYQLNGTAFNGINANNNGSSASCYWIVRQFGNGSIAYNGMNFTLPNNNTISNTDETNPSNLKLYKRPDNFILPFGTFIANATTANNSTKVIEFTGFTPQNSFSQFEIGSSNSLLPVTLLNFTGKRTDDNNALLEWTTATESNNKGFDIESSENGVSFSKIAFVDGVGNSNLIMNYKLSIINKEDTYYRLRQVDFDGKFAYSNIIFVKGNESAIIVYPNPTHEKINIMTSKENFGYKLTNIEGKEIIKENETSNTTTFFVNTLPKGIYLVHIIQDNKTTIKKIVLE